MLLPHGKRSVPAIANDVDEQSVGNLSLDSGHVHDVVAIMNGPALDACPASKLPHRDAQKVATTFAFFQYFGSKVFCTEASPPEGLAAQPELYQLLAISANRQVPTHRKQRCMHIGGMAIKGKSAGGEQAVVKQSGARPMAANHKYR
jgi:hypothetical protein